jgi:hypothetical protein
MASLNRGHHVDNEPGSPWENGSVGSFNGKVLREGMTVMGCPTTRAGMPATVE